MLSPARSRASMAFLLLAMASLVSAHMVMVYPGWRGDNLLSNGTLQETGGMGVGDNNTYPYGMQWIYPCGGMPISTNRTKWPIYGGAVAWQPGWFAGHQYAFQFINLGIGTLPPNMSHVMVPAFQIVGPTNFKYNGTVCLPQVPLPSGYTPNVGDNATIQVVELAQHGAALYSCVDITFDLPENVPEVNASNCFNSSDMSFELVFTTTSISASAATALSNPASIFYSLPLLMVLAIALL